MAQPLLSSQWVVGVCSKVFRRNFEIILVMLEDRDPKIFGLAHCAEHVPVHAFCCLFPSDNDTFTYIMGEKNKILEQLIMNHTKTNPTTLYWGHKEKCSSAFMVMRKKEVWGSNAPKVACKSLCINTTWQERFLSPYQTMYFPVIFFYLYWDCLVWLTASLLVPSWGNLFFLLCLYVAEEENCR